MKNQKRFDAIESIAERYGTTAQPPCSVDIDCYAEDVFDSSKMCQYLPQKTARKLLATLNDARPLDATIADDVAHAMKEWAVSRGATHYTHWFQPLTGGTAEKHDSFLEFDNGKAIFSFSGKNLIVGEPDASSFPSGGLRCTFEARGYTAWDPTSPAFIKRHSNGATLCIPTVFCSYTGEVLDRKTPLLRSGQVLRQAVSRLMKCFGKPEETVKVTLGAEQEYFLIDKKFYLQRPDLIQTGRTIFGAPPAKHQQLEDHYFGSIRPRILAFMTEVEKELWKLGIPAKTRHNEAAPAQFELASTYEDLNLAVDHNMLVMEVLRTAAERHGLVCLLHEKPFAGVNGSGKHNNWSVSYGGRNLLDPGSSPSENAIFLTMLTAVIRAVDLHSDLLRSTTAGAGNDHRLGANEAPPAIISIFLGTQLTEILDSMVQNKVSRQCGPMSMKIGVDSIPALSRDATDRNRTSPFAFTGNKFEFRGPGSSQSCAGVNTVLNTIVAESLDYICDSLEKSASKDLNSSLNAIIKKIIGKHRRVIFNGDNYSKDWEIEAGKRGLPNLRNTLQAIKPLIDKDNQALFQKYSVFTPVELNSRYEVFLDEYSRKIKIEGGVALEIARTMIAPVLTESYLNLAAVNLKSTAGANSIKLYLKHSGELLDSLTQCCSDLEAAMSSDCLSIIDCIQKLRTTVDAIEGIIDDSAWPLPKYREMLFIY